MSDFSFDFGGSAANDFSFSFGSAPLKYPHAMIDIESVGTRPFAPMLAIGMVSFDLAQMKIGEYFYTNIDLASKGKV